MAKSGAIKPTLTRNNYFVDFGAGYSKEKIESGKSYNYILVYEMEKKDIAKKYTLRITDEIEYKAGTLNAKYKNISLKPQEYYSQETVGTYKIGDNMTFYDSILGNSSLKVDSYDFMSKYVYKYEACIRNNCSDMTDVVTADSAKAKKLLVLNGNLVLDKNSTFSKNLKTGMSFFDAFVQIKYDDKIAPVTNSTPKSITDKYILQIDENVLKAKKVDLILTIRNKKYVLNMK